MVMTDPIADMLSRIRNAYRVKILDLQLPYSRMKSNILRVLEKEGYIRDYKEEKGQDGFQILSVTLSYSPAGAPAIKKIDRLSKPGKRLYKPVSRIKPPCGGLGTLILSTSLGVISDKDALHSSVGGEVICNVF